MIDGNFFEYFSSYDELGNTRGTPRFTALKPVKLKWNISESVGVSPIDLERRSTVDF